MTDNKHPSFIAVNLTPAMSGYFATLYSWTVDDFGQGYYEPWTTGVGRYATWQEANVEGEAWAKDEGLEFKPATEEAVKDAEADLAKFMTRMRRVRELRESGMGMKEAMDKAKEEGL